MERFRVCFADGSVGRIVACGRAVVSVGLCLLMVGQPVLGETVGTRATGGEDTQEQARVLHALNRLTFGPRPGDVTAVQAMGLNRWFERQLNPGSIDDSKLEQRLVEYPAMQMPMAELERRYPSPLVIRQMSAGKVALPSDPTEHAMAMDQIAFYEMGKAKKAAETQAAGTQAAGTQAAGTQGAGTGAEGMADGPMNGQAAMPGKKGAKNSVAAGMAALDQEAAMGEGQNGMEKPIPASEISADPGAVTGLSGRERFSQEEAMRIVNLPPEERMRTILGMPAAQMVKFRQSLGAGEVAQMVSGLTPQQRETLMALPGSLRMVALESMESRVLRDVYSERQLEAVMTDFWLNHFNVYVRKNQNEPYLLPSYERETIRPHALGKFEDLLVATAKSPAMLEYLDNFRSIGADSVAAMRVKRVQQMRPNGQLAKLGSAGLNENYGRELMELHTLGVGGGYTQADVSQVAKVFTGWTIDKPYQGGGYTFNENRHEPGSKVVLGKTIPEGGEREGLEVLHLLATNPATAHFISEKLAVRFVSDAPPAGLVDRMAASFLKSDGDIKAVLRTMWQSPEFWAPEVYRAKVKTPIEFVVSAVRASGLQVNNPQALVQSLDKLGMPVYGMQTPNGYSWKQDEWVSTGALVSRMNFSLVLSGDRLPGTRTEWTQLLGGAGGGVMPASYEPANAAKERRLEEILLGQPVSERTRATVLGQSGDENVTAQAETQFDLSGGGGKKNYAYGKRRGGANGGPDEAGSVDDRQAAVMAGLLLGSPEFQRR